MPEARAAEAQSHVHPVRVYYEDTDAGGVVYHASYFRFAERARTEMLRALGVAHRELIEAEGYQFVVRRCAADFRRPARLDDRLDVVTRVTALGATRVALAQDVRRDGAELVAIEVELVGLGTSGRPARMPGRLKRALNPLIAA